jgi:hypothetical protein
VSDAWIDFATFNLATGVHAGGLDGHPYAGLLVPPPLEATGTLLDDDNRFYPMATTYYRLNHAGGEMWLGLDAAAPGVFFSVHPTDDGTKDGAVLPAVASLWGDDPGPLSLGELPAGQYFVWGAQPTDADDSVKVRFCAGAETEVLDCFGLLPVDEVPGEEPEDDKGCGCASSGGVGVWWIGLGLFGWRARRSSDRDTESHRVRHRVPPRRKGK